VAERDLFEKIGAIYTNIPGNRNGINPGEQQSF